jgi:iron complex outermembrane receptor protein
LGDNASLQLLNGHRMAGQGVSSIAPDPNAIPFAAVERVEVVLDGASSVYGSDAVAGVVNFRMRRDFEGADLQVSGQSGPYDIGKVELVAGHTWENANFMVGLSKEYTTPMLSSESPFLSADLTRWGGRDDRARNNGYPGPNGLIRVGNTLYGNPAPGWTGETVTSVTYGGNTYNLTTPVRRPLLSEVLAAPVEVVDDADYSYYRGASDRRNLFVSAGFQISDDLRLEYTGMVSKRETRNLSFGTRTVTITEYSPYYMADLVAYEGRPAGSSYTVNINMAENGLPAKSRNYARTQNHYLDLTWDIGEFQWTSSLSWGDTKGCDICRTEGNNAALRHDPAGTPVGYRNYVEVGFDNLGNPRGGNPEWYNPYIQGGQNPNALDERIVGYTYRAGNQWQNGFTTRLEGPLMDLPGGTLRGSIGAEYIDSNHWLWLNQDVRYYPTNGKQDYVLRDTTYGREVGSYFAEIYVPLIGDSNAMPGVQRFAVNLSARHDEYSDFGGTTNPRVGVVWDVNDDLSLRASWGTSFKAPTIEQVNPGVNSVMSASWVDADPAIGLPGRMNGTNFEILVMRRSGRTPTLGPETSTNWSFGFDYSPYQLDGLDLQATYYDIQYDDRIQNLPNSNSAWTSPANFARYAPYITTFTQPATCVENDTATYAPEFLKFLAYPGTRYNGSDGFDCMAVAEMEVGLQNVGSVHQNGLDTQASYTWANDLGIFRASLNVAKILTLERTLEQGGQYFNVLDIRGWQTSLRMTGRLSWAYDNFSAALSSKTEGSYTNEDDPSGNDKTIPKWTTFDLTATYQTPDDGTLLSGIRASLGIQNLTDKDPPIVNTSSSVVDTSVHNLFGRMVRFELSKSF